MSASTVHQDMCALERPSLLLQEVRQLIMDIHAQLVTTVHSEAMKRPNVQLASTVNTLVLSLKKTVSCVRLAGTMMLKALLDARSVVQPLLQLREEQQHAHVLEPIEPSSNPLELAFVSKVSSQRQRTTMLKELRSSIPTVLRTVKLM